MGSARRRSERKARSRSRTRRKIVGFEHLERRELLALTPAAVILTVAGSSAGGDPATLASLDSPQGVAVDSAGNVFFSDSLNNVVREVNHATGAITTIAGTGTPGFSGDGGPATAAELWGPVGLALDSAGDLFIADANNIRIREVNLNTGLITTVAGDGAFGSSGNKGPATAAAFGYPGAVVVDSSGDLFISDYLDNTVREVKNGIITDVAGNGGFTFSGDGGQASLAALATPTQLALNSAGDLFIADSGNYRIREVDLATGIITTVAGTGGDGYAGDGGPATDAALTTPQGLAVDSAGDLLIADTAVQRIREVNATTGIITTVAGDGAAGYAGDGGQATAASLDEPQQIAVNSAGDIVFADGNDNRVRQVNPATGIITTVAGGGQVALNGNGGQASLATLAAPQAVIVDAAGDLLIADTSDNVVRMVNHVTGVITTIAGDGTAGYSGDDGLAGAAELSAPSGLALDSAGDLFIADSGNSRVREVNHLTGIITTVVGNGTAGFSGDEGPATAAEIDMPMGLAINSAGDLFFADDYNGRIREVNALTGYITTVAGDGTQGYGGDSGPATAAELNFPRDVALDSAGDLYIADTANNRIREVNLASGLISTVAGTGSAGPLGDGGAATAASLSAPAGVAVGASGNLWIADSLDARIRDVNLANGLITTLAGSGTASFAGDGGPASAAELSSPSAVALDSSGDLFVADSGNNRIREIDSSAVRTTPNVSVSDPGGTYDALPYPATATVNGGASLEGVTPTLTYYAGTAAAGTALTTVPSHAGAYTVVASFAGSTDDTAAQSVPLTFVIGQAPLAITADNETKAYGAPVPALAVSYSGFVGSDGPASLTSQPLVSTMATAASPVSGSPYPIIVSGAAEPDYAITYVMGKLTVTAAPTTITVAASAPSITLGQSVLLTASVTAWPVPSEGTVTFFAAGTALGTAPVSAGVATLLTTSLPPGTDVVTAGYQDPAGQFASSTVSVGPDSTIVAAAGAGNYAGDGGPATAAMLHAPQGIVIDSAGDVFIADSANSAVREINHATGVITTIAGTGTSGYNGDNMSATAAQLSIPLGLAINSAGDLFIADSGNDRIREVNLATGIITTVAGGLGIGYAGDNGPATGALLNMPTAVAFDSAGDLLIADEGNGAIREVNAGSGVITTIAGNGTLGYLGDGGPATAAELDMPSDIVLDSAGNIFIADSGNNRIREVLAANGTIKTIAGTGAAAFGGDGGPATAAELRQPEGIALDSAGDLLISDTANSRVREINHATGVITTIAGTGTPNFSGDGGPATAANIATPTALAFDTAGDLLIADSLDNRIRELNAMTGVIATVAGSSYVTISGDGGPATAATISWPQAAVADSAGDLFIVDSLDDVVREVNHLTGIITTVAGNGHPGFSGDGGPATAAELDDPQGIAIDSAGDVFISDAGNNRIREINHATGLITTIAGNGGFGYNGDGIPATSASLSLPGGLAVDTAGDVLIADMGNNRIREVNAATGIITTVAGDASAGFAGDGGPATAAELYLPASVTLDSAGDLFIADTENNRIREVNHVTGVITTVAGNGIAGYSGDGSSASAAELSEPSGVAVDSAGDVFIADTGNQRIQEVNGSTGTVITLAGGSSGVGGNGGPASAATLVWPEDVALDAAGDLLITEPTAGKISEIVSGTVVDVMLPPILAPSVTNATAVQNSQSTSGLVITPNSQNIGTVTGFQITNILGGTLYLNDGVTPVSDGQFITTTEGAGGLKFSPATNSIASGSFAVQAADDGYASGSVVDATITVTVVPPTSSIAVLGYRTSDTSIPLSLSGSAGSGGPIVAYNIYESTNGAKLTEIATVNASSSTYSVSDLLAGNTYGFASQAIDTANNQQPMPATADTSVTITATPWQNPNPGDALDVIDNGGTIVPQDALAIINYLNLNPGGGSLPSIAPADSYYYDVLGQNDVVPADALAVIDYLNLHPAAVVLAQAQTPLPAVAAPAATAIGSAVIVPGSLVPAPVGSASDPAAAIGSLLVTVTDASSSGSILPPVSPALMAVSSLSAGRPVEGEASAAASGPNDGQIVDSLAAGLRAQEVLRPIEQAADALYADAASDWWHVEAT